jgi:hypothetical protein
MTFKVDPRALTPLWSVVKSGAEPALRLAALRAAAGFPLGQKDWRRVAGLTRGFIGSEPAGTVPRREALRLATLIPLDPVRRRLRSLVSGQLDPDWDVVAEALDEAGDPSRIRALLAQAESGHAECFARLAAMPVEGQGVGAGQVPALPPDPAPNAPLWRALLLARLGDFGALDAILEGPAAEPELFWGSPWSAYDALARMRPVPPPLRAHLLEALGRLADSERRRMVELIAWALTGIADAEGTPVPAIEVPAVRSAPVPPVERPIPVTLELTRRLFEQSVTDDEMVGLAHLPPGRFGELVRQTVIEANRRARVLPEGVPANQVLGNTVVRLVLSHPSTAQWRVCELAIEQVRAPRPALDDDQVAWIIARDDPAQLIRTITGALTPDRPLEERLRLLGLLRGAADHRSGRGGSPARGAGPAAPPPPAPPSARAAPPPPSMPAPSPEAPQVAEEGAVPGEEEDRRVHAQIRQAGRGRRTFVAGAENVIRCWIGLPEDERAAFAAQPIPLVDIPPEGLPLTVELCWRDQSDSKPLVLPADRTARSADCDLRLQVPAGVPYLSADVVFRYRGRAFEVVQVGASVVAPGQPEEPAHRVDVHVQVSRRGVVDLPERSPYDATVIWSAEADSSALRVFGGQGGRGYDLADAEQAIRWLNEELFAAEKSLVRRRAAQGGAEAVLDAEDEEVLDLLRTMARHGATLYNQLREQGFEDPGERLQLLNLKANAHVPLEFVYDRGYPADDARLCAGWREALLGDGGCPACDPHGVPPGQRDWMPVICPLGFWSLQKIIERHDTGGEADGGAEPSAHPSTERRSLPVIDGLVFASSHNVPQEERDATWSLLCQTFAEPVLARDWLEWRAAVERHPPLLLALPHHDVAKSLDYLQIGDEHLPVRQGQLNRGQLTEDYVNPQNRQPGPLVLLLGCRTAQSVEDGYVQMARRFQRLHASIVVGTLAQILGRHAAPLARELVAQLVGVSDGELDFGAIMRRVRRRMLARGYLMALCLVALGDAEWRLTPRAAGRG